MAGTLDGKNLQTGSVPIKPDDISKLSEPVVTKAEFDAMVGGLSTNHTHDYSTIISENLDADTVDGHHAVADVNDNTLSAIVTVERLHKYVTEYIEQYASSSGVDILEVEGSNSAWTGWPDPILSVVAGTPLYPGDAGFDAGASYNVQVPLTVTLKRLPSASDPQFLIVWNEDGDGTEYIISDSATANPKNIQTNPATVYDFKITMTTPGKHRFAVGLSNSYTGVNLNTSEDVGRLDNDSTVVLAPLVTKAFVPWDSIWPGDSANSGEIIPAVNSVAWTVPVGVTRIVALLTSGGGCGNTVNDPESEALPSYDSCPLGGNSVLLTLSVTPGDTLTVSPGAGGNSLRGYPTQLNISSSSGTLKAGFRLFQRYDECTDTWGALPISAILPQLSVLRDGDVDWQSFIDAAHIPAIVESIAYFDHSMRPNPNTGARGDYRRKFAVRPGISAPPEYWRSKLRGATPSNWPNEGIVTYNTPATGGDASLGTPEAGSYLRQPPGTGALNGVPGQLYTQQKIIGSPGIVLIKYGANVQALTSQQIAQYDFGRTYYKLLAPFNAYTTGPDLTNVVPACAAIQAGQGKYLTNDDIYPVDDVLTDAQHIELS